MAMMAITTKSSTSVNPFLLFDIIFFPPDVGISIGDCGARASRPPFGSPLF
jgi:hypothetical protein